MNFFDDEYRARATAIAALPLRISNATLGNAQPRFLDFQPPPAPPLQSRIHALATSNWPGLPFDTRVIVG